MIAKVKTRSNLSGLMSYLTKDTKEWECLGDNMGDIPIDAQLEAMQCVADQNQRLKKNAFHGSISLKPEERNKLSKKDWQTIGHGFMKHMGFEDAPYSLIIHKERAHLHIHCAASRTNYFGDTVSDSMSYIKAMEYMRLMEIEYGLDILETPEMYTGTKAKSSKELHAEKRGEKLVKTKIKDIIDQAILNATGTTYQEYDRDFISMVKKAGIGVRLHKHKSGEVYGMSFDMEGRVFKSSKLGKKYQYKQLKARLRKHFNHKYRIKMKIEVPRVTTKKPSQNIAHEKGPKRSKGLGYGHDQEEDEEIRKGRKWDINL